MNNDLFRGRDLVSVPTSEIKAAISTLRRSLTYLETVELPAREGVIAPLYGFLDPNDTHTYVTWPTFAEAAAVAVIDLKDPDAGYRVIQIWRPDPRKTTTADPS